MAAGRPWTEGKSPELHEQWQFIEDPAKHAKETKGLQLEDSAGKNEIEEAKRKGKELGEKRSRESTMPLQTNGAGTNNSNFKHSLWTGTAEQ